MQPQQVHLRDERLPRDHLHDPHVRGVQGGLLFGGGDADQLGRPRRKLLQDRVAGAAEEDAAEPLAKLIEVLVAQHLALLVDHAMAVEEAEGRRQAAVVDELHHGVQLVEAVLQRRAAEDQGEGRLQPLDHPGGLRLPVLDPLALRRG